MFKLLTLLLGISTFVFANDKLVVGTNSEFPPFSYQNNGEIVGFDIDVAKEVAQRMNKSLVFKDMPFDALIPEITLGHVDLVAAGMSYTAERANRVLFTKPYLNENPLAILTLAKNPAKPVTLDDLKGKTIVINEGYLADIYLSQKKGFNLVRLATAADGFMALKSKRADAFVTALGTVQPFLETQNASQFQLDLIPDTSENCAMAIPKNKPELLTEVQNALNNMEADGTLEKLRVKWKLSNV